MSFHEEQAHLRSRGRKALWLACGLTFFFMLGEVYGGLVSGSLALLADAGHMLTDFLALGFALFAFWVADKPPTQRMSYGFHRAEILAALANGVFLINVVVFIFIEALKRLSTPPPVASDIMLFFALAGFLVNLASAFILRSSSSCNLNVRGAFFHVISDMVGSVGVLAAGLGVRWFHWAYADAVAGMLIGVLIVVCAWKLLKDSAAILLEAAPGHIDLDCLEAGLLGISGVKNVHDLHVWTISSGKEALSVHLGVEETAPPDRILREVNVLLEEKFNIFHSTVQLETEHPSRHHHPDF